VPVWLPSSWSALGAPLVMPACLFCVDLVLMVWGRGDRVLIGVQGGVLVPWPGLDGSVSSSQPVFGFRMMG